MAGWLVLPAAVGAQDDDRPRLNHRVAVDDGRAVLRLWCPAPRDRRCVGRLTISAWLGGDGGRRDDCGRPIQPERPTQHHLARRALRACRTGTRPRGAAGCTDREPHQSRRTSSRHPAVRAAHRRRRTAWAGWPSGGSRGGGSRRTAGRDGTCRTGQGPGARRDRPDREGPRGQRDRPGPRGHRAFRVPPERKVLRAPSAPRGRWAARPPPPAQPAPRAPAHRPRGSTGSGRATGPEGPVGPAGSPGPSGPQGAQGLQGLPGISGYQPVVATSANDSVSPRATTATCPDRKDRHLGLG